MCHSVQCTVYKCSYHMWCSVCPCSGVWTGVHSQNMVCKDLRVRPVFSHNYGGHLLCVVHVHVIDSLVNKKLYTVYVRLAGM